MKTLIIGMTIVAIVVNLVAFVGDKIVKKKFAKIAEERKKYDE